MNTVSAATHTDDEINIDKISSQLDTFSFGKKVIYLPVSGSTNEEAKKIAAHGAAEGTVIISKEQTGGKGRLNRSFFCPPGGLWFSLILRPSFAPAEANKITLMASVAVAETLRQKKFAVKIKWPNDVYLHGKKITGILTEMRLKVGKVDFAVLGIGLNVNIAAGTFPPNVRETATSLLIENGSRIDMEQLFVDLMRSLENLYIAACHNGYDSVWDKWRKYSLTLNQTVNVISCDGSTFSGVAVDIDTDGALLVQTKEGMRRVLADDVSIR